MIYNHGGRGTRYGKDILDFSANINPFGISDAVKNAVAAAVSECEEYPDCFCGALRGKIAEREGVPPDDIICGSGAAELIYTIAYAVMPRFAYIMKPSFTEYAAAVRAAGGAVSDNADECSIEFICNPNNPTGALTEPETVQKRLKSGRLIVVDECFNDFLENPASYSCVNMTRDYKNLVVLKSFTKMYAMPGIRIGYLITSDEALKEKIYRARQPWAVSSVAQAAGLAACGDTVTPELTRRFMTAERRYLTRELERLGIRYEQPSANYIFFYAEPGLQEKLLREKLLIRSCADYDGLGENAYRAAIRTHEENTILIKGLEKVIWQSR